MSRLFFVRVWGVSVLLLASSAMAVDHTRDDLVAQPVDYLSDLLGKANTQVAFRARVENLHEDPLGSSHANTGALHMLYTTPAYKNLAFLFDFRHVTSYGSNKFNQGEGLTPSRSSRPVIRDPNGTTLLRGYVQYNKFQDYVFRLGRQHLDLDDERFVGSDAQRQTPQSFDALSISSNNNTLYGLNWLYAYVAQANTVYAGSRTANGTHHHQTHLSNVTWQALPFLTSSFYAYWINDRTTVTNNNHTYGMHLEGEWPAGDLSYAYSMAYARQFNAPSSRVDFHAHYWKLMGEVTYNPITVSAYSEHLQGNRVADRGFRTPLASFSRKNGYLERFNPIPSGGLLDHALLLEGTFDRYTMHLERHQFKQETPSLDFGNEWDLSLSTHYLDNLDLELSIARFAAQTGSGMNDARKITVQATASF